VATDLNTCEVFKAEGLKYFFEGGRECALNNLNFSIMSGESIAIVGPNGAGKSTLLNIMLGYADKYEGVFEFMGREISGWKPSQMARVRAYIPQENETGLKLTALEYLKLSRGAPHLTEKSEINKYLELFDISYLRDRVTATMSGGEMRLLQLIFALLRNPSVVLLDEPVSFLDVNNQKKFFDGLKEISSERSDGKGEKMTIISILHDLNMAAYYCDRIMLLNKGEIVKFDSPLDVINFKTLGSIFFRESLTREVKMKEGGAEISAHVICGGGAGSEIMEALLSQGVNVSAGVLNIGDSDWNFCKNNKVAMVEEEPFQKISDENYIKNLEYIKKADVIVLCAFALGKGNLANLKFIEESGMILGKKIISAFSAHAELDFTGGAAGPLLKKIGENSERFLTPDEFKTVFARVRDSLKKQDRLS